MTSDHEVRVKTARAELMKRILIVVTAVLVMALLVLSGYMLTQIRVNQQLTQSCVIPGRPCYERGQQQTADAVADINRVIILAAACAGDLPDGLSSQQRADLITACVTKRLADADHS